MKNVHVFMISILLFVLGATMAEASKFGECKFGESLFGLCIRPSASDGGGGPEAGGNIYATCTTNQLLVADRCIDIGDIQLLNYLDRDLVISWFNITVGVL